MAMRSIKKFLKSSFFAAVSINLPGTPANGTGGSTIGPFIQNFYLFALLISGILAFGAIVWGGIKYAAGRGNPSSESEGKSWIYNALLGILLLAGAWIILNTINPNLVSLQLPTLSGVTATAPQGGAPQGGALAPGQCADGSCQSLSNSGFACKSASQQPGGILSCSADQDMINTLDCMQQHGAPPMTITEAMPPTSQHESHCHTDGCCVDVAVNSGNCSDVNAMLAAAQACGTTALNEYANCQGNSYTYTNGNNVHINANGCN